MFAVLQETVKVMSVIRKVKNQLIWTSFLSLAHITTGHCPHESLTAQVGLLKKAFRIYATIQKQWMQYMDVLPTDLDAWKTAFDMRFFHLA